MPNQQTAKDPDQTEPLIKQLFEPIPETPNSKIGHYDEETQSCNI